MPMTFYLKSVVFDSLSVPNEERVHLPVSLRETKLRPPGPDVRPPLFPFPPQGGRP